MTDQDEERQKKRCEILAKYVQADGESQVNLSYELRQKLLVQSDNAERTFFDEASREIQYLLETDLWFEFIRTYTLNTRLRMARDMAFEWIKNPRMICTRQFFSFPHPINELDSRLHNLLCALVAALLVCLQYFAAVNPLYIGSYLVYGYVVRGLCGPRLDIQGWLVLFVLQPQVDGFKLGRLTLASKFVPGPPRRFVQFVGGTITSAALILNSLTLSGIWDIGHWIATGLYLTLCVLAMIAFIFNKCAGCYAFKLLMQFGCIPASTCQQCSMAINDNRSTRKVQTDTYVPAVLF